MGHLADWLRPTVTGPAAGRDRADCTAAGARRRRLLGGAHHHPLGQQVRHGLRRESAKEAALSGQRPPPRWRLHMANGFDDQRQDAVMQRVFSVLNGLLTDNGAPDRPPLVIRKIVSHSQRSGPIE